MESEIFELMNETMEINHDITNYIIKIAEADIEGRRIKEEGKEERKISINDVEENKAIKGLFKLLQEKYRKMSKLIVDLKKMEEEDMKDLSGYAIGVMAEDDYLTLSISEKLLEYLVQSYANLRYISVCDEMDNTIIQESIYKNKPFEILHTAEYMVQVLNLDNIETRVISQERGLKLSPQEKVWILDDYALKMFYKKFSMENMENYINEFEENKEYISKEIYDNVRTRLYEQKYKYIYEYLQNKYNGFLQENDIGKLEEIARGIDYLDGEGIYLILKMSKFDVDENINARILQYIKDLEDTVVSIEDANIEVGDTHKKTKDTKNYIRCI